MLSHRCPRHQRLDAILAQKHKGEEGETRGKKKENNKGVNQESEKAKRKERKFPINESEESKRRKSPDQGSEENKRNRQKGLWTRQYLNNTELSPNERKEGKETMT